jgi:hypothetical protein
MDSDSSGTPGESEASSEPPPPGEGGSVDPGGSAFKFDPYTGRALGPDPDPGPHSVRRRWLVFGLIGVLVVALAAGVFAAVGHHGGHDLTIAMDLTNSSDPTIEQFSSGCDVADTGYDDLKAGAPVTIRDSKAEVLASTFLSDGKTVGEDCTWKLRVHVPDSDFYAIEVSHRGSVTYTRQDLERNGWEADLSIGG